MQRFLRNDLAVFIRYGIVIITIIDVIHVHCNRMGFAALIEHLCRYCTAADGHIGGQRAGSVRGIDSSAAALLIRAFGDRCVERAAVDGDAALICRIVLRAACAERSCHAVGRRGGDIHIQPVLGINVQRRRIILARARGLQTGTDAIRRCTGDVDRQRRNRFHILRHADGQTAQRTDTNRLTGQPVGVLFCLKLHRQAVITQIVCKIDVDVRTVRQHDSERLLTVGKNTVYGGFRSVRDGRAVRDMHGAAERYRAVSIIIDCCTARNRIGAAGGTQVNTVYIQTAGIGLQPNMKPV